MTVFVANSNLLTLVGLKAFIGGAFVNDADVEVTVVDSEGVNVAGATWPQIMGYVAASDGNYRVVLTHELAFEAKRNYTAKITADGGVDRIGYWEFKFKPLIRTGVTAGT